MQLINANPNPKFDELEPGKSKAYYLDPVSELLLPCFVLDNTQPAMLDFRTLTFLLVPAIYIDRPMNELPLESLRKISITVPKGMSMVLASTNPPTIYCTTEEELKLWKLQNP